MPSMPVRSNDESRLYTDHLSQLYPYHVWFDGHLWELIQGEDYHCSLISIRKHLYETADSFGYKVRTRATPKGLLVQAVDKVTGQPLPVED